MKLPEWWGSDKPYKIMDCLEGMKALPDKAIDLVLTDPPYGIDVIGGSKKSIGGSKIVEVNHYEMQRWDTVPISQEFWDEIKRISKNQIVFGYNYATELFGSCRGLIVWDKKCQNDWNDYFSDGEVIYTSFNKPLKIYRQLWMGVVRESDYNIENHREHPTQKPIGLIKWILQNYTKENDIVLDCYLGSGSVLAACHYTHRIGLGFEIEPSLEHIIRKRSLQDIPDILSYDNNQVINNDLGDGSKADPGTLK